MDIHHSLNFFDFSVIAGYIIILLGLGFWVSFEKKEHTDDLFLAGRSLRWFNVGLSIFGTNVSPSMMISTCGVAYASGMVAGNVEWLAWIFLMLLAMIFVPNYLNTNVCTMPEFMDRRYGKSCRNFLSWYVLFTTLVVWLGANLYAGGLLLGQILNWPLWISVIFLMAIAASFTIFGGLKAVVITDSFQSILMIVVSAILTLIGLSKVGGVGKLVQSVPADYWKLFRPADDPTFPWPAIVFGWPVGAIYFWCTDQTIVQRILGAKDLKQGQLGAVFAGYLKILTPLIFFLPGILCFILHPGLESEDEAYMTMVTTYLPNGMIGLIVAVLIAALVSTVDSGLNSFSTVFTLDVYRRQLRPGASDGEVKIVGQVATALAAVTGVILALAIGSVKGMNLFSVIQAIIFSLAPSMTVVFLFGILWKRGNSKGALSTLVIGNIITVSIGICILAKWPSREFWPHYLLMAFYNFLGLSVLYVVISLLTGKPPVEKRLPSIKEAYIRYGHHASSIWKWWAVLLLIMVIIYMIFN